MIGFLLLRLPGLMQVKTGCSEVSSRLVKSEVEGVGLSLKSGRRRLPEEVERLKEWNWKWKDRIFGSGLEQPDLLLKSSTLVRLL